MIQINRKSSRILKLAPSKHRTVKILRF